MTSKLVVNTIEADTGISSVSFGSSISLSSTSKFHFGNAGIDIGADTNINRPSAGVLGFNVNGAEKVRIDSSGHMHGVGVVTATHFYGDGSNLTGITQTTINNNANNRLITGSGTANTLEGEANLTYDGTNLRLGTTTAAISAGIGLMIADAAGARIKLCDSDQGVTASDGFEIIQSNNGNAFIYNRENSPIIFGTNNTERMRITHEGSVGIGTDGSTYELEVHDGSGAAALRLKDGANNVICDLIAGSTGGHLRTTYNHPLLFSTNQVERLRIDTSGRMLLGTTDTHGSDADDIVIATSGTTGITIRSGTSSSGNIYFADGNSGTSLYRGRVSYNHGDDSLFLGTANANNSLKISSDGRIGLRHDLSGTADYNRMMIYNPNSGSCWIQLMSTATGNSANTDGLSIGLNTSNIAHIWQRENAEMHFATNNSLRWRITTSGDVYPQGNYNIGLNSNTAFRMNEVNSNKFVHRYGTSGSATNNQQEAIWYGGGITVMHDNATLQTTNYTWGLTGHRGYPLFRIKNSNQGAIYAESGSISSGSDYRMKENIEEITNGIETVKKLKPSKYNIRKSFNPLDDGKKHHGFIAHEVQEAIPDIGNIVTGTKDGMEEVFYGVEEDDVIPEGKKAGDSTGTFTDNPDMQGIDYGHMTPVLAAAIKELITKVETLEQENITLRARVTNLEGN